MMLSRAFSCRISLFMLCDGLRRNEEEDEIVGEGFSWVCLVCYERWRMNREESGRVFVYGFCWVISVC